MVRQTEGRDIKYASGRMNSVAHTEVPYKSTFVVVGCHKLGLFFGGVKVVMTAVDMYIKYRACAGEFISMPQDKLYLSIVFVPSLAFFITLNPLLR